MTGVAKIGNEWRTVTLPGIAPDRESFVVTGGEAVRVVGFGEAHAGICRVRAGVAIVFRARTRRTASALGMVVCDTVWDLDEVRREP